MHRQAGAAVLPEGFGALHRGERAALALALELGSARFLADDLRARRAATRLDLTVLGSVGIALRAKESGLIAVVRPTLDALVGVGLYIDLPLYQRALKASGEPPAEG